jgi:hypothetical protein
MHAVYICFYYNGDFYVPNIKVETGHEFCVCEFQRVPSNKFKMLQTFENLTKIILCRTCQVKQHFEDFSMSSSSMLRK